MGLCWEYDFVPVTVDRGLERVPLLDDPIHALLPASHPAARSRALDLADLADLPWITSTPRSSCNPFTERACRAAGFEPRVVAETDDHRALQGLVAEGVGAALESELSLRDLRADVAVVPLARPLRRSIFAVHRVDAGPAVSGFVETLRSVAAPRLEAVRSPVQAA